TIGGGGRYRSGLPWVHPTIVRRSPPRVVAAARRGRRRLRQFLPGLPRRHRRAARSARAESGQPISLPRGACPSPTQRRGPPGRRLPRTARDRRLVAGDATVLADQRPQSVLRPSPQPGVDERDAAVDGFGRLSPVLGSPPRPV